MLSSLTFARADVRPPVNLDPIWRSLRDLLSATADRVPYFVVALIVFLVFLLTAKLVRIGVRRASKRARVQENLAELLGRLLSALTGVLGLLVACVVVFPTFRPGDLVAGLGLTTVAVGFAFKDILQNFFAGILILWRQPFQVGDEIKTMEYEGVVENINTRSTRIRTYDGERAVVPNGEVYTRPILVRTAYPVRRVRVIVGIAYEADLVRARGIIFDAVSNAKGVAPDPGPWVYVHELAPYTLNLQIYFWTASQQSNVLKVQDSVLTAVKQACDRQGIILPYPTQVIMMKDGESSS